MRRFNRTSTSNSLHHKYIGASKRFTVIDIVLCGVWAKLAASDRGVSRRSFGATMSEALPAVMNSGGFWEILNLHKYNLSRFDRSGIRIYSGKRDNSHATVEFREK